MRITKAIRRAYYDDDKNWEMTIEKRGLYKVERLIGSQIHRFDINHIWESLGKKESRWFTQVLFTFDDRNGCRSFSMSNAEIDERLKKVDDIKIVEWHRKNRND